MMISLKETIRQRNNQIWYLFKKVGWRQKKIAEQVELSESRVKKIIGEMKKNELNNV